MSPSAIAGFGFLAMLALIALRMPVGLAMLVTGSADSTIAVWDTDRRQSVGQSLRIHSREIYGLAFSPDGSMLASADFAGGTFLSVIKYEDPVTRVCAIVNRNFTEVEQVQYVGPEAGLADACPVVGVASAGGETGE